MNSKEEIQKYISIIISHVGLSDDEVIPELKPEHNSQDRLDMAFELCLLLCKEYGYIKPPMIFAEYAQPDDYRC